jgi:sigma-B regulation protein RsbQ
MDQNYIGWANYLAPVISGEVETGALSRELSDSFCSTDPVVARIFAQTTFFSDNRADLPKVSRPCLVLQHRHDSLAPLAVGEYLHSHLQGSTLKILDVAGHCGHMSHPSLVVEAMREYLDTQHSQA